MTLGHGLCLATEDHLLRMEIMRVNFLLAALASLTISTGCGEDSPGEPIEVLFERELTGDAPEADIDALVAGNTQFAFEIYDLLDADSSANLVFGPLSISRAFSNYYQSGGLNEDQFLGVFHYLPDPAASETAFRALSVQLMSRNTSDPRASFFETNDIYWVDSSEVVDLSTLNFDRVHSLPFRDDPEYARGVINDWISDRSRGLLTDFLDPGVITADTFRVTTNAIFFIGNWTYEYTDKTLNFQSRSGPKPVSAFGGQASYQYRIAQDYTKIRIPYTEGYSLVAVMPQDMAAFRATLNPTRFAEILQDHETGLVDLRIPEIETKSAPDIVEAITTLRERAGFDASGTLTGAFQETYVHKAVIKADKDGTTAAAATAIIEYDNNSPEPPEAVSIDLDRPFMYFIIEDRTDTILFLGHFVGE